ncbi:hypothetical protein AAMO2058_000109300 [Amorphochlora amoebiformis]|mmetsp:Transcript_25135/g.39728  ORF Transcript_25135/g.39728 Transcript_25135/m.39728 type:complete len:178 (-) Transcript_25135:134-667(-)
MGLVIQCRCVQDKDFEDAWKARGLPIEHSRATSKHFPETSTKGQEEEETRNEPPETRPGATEKREGTAGETQGKGDRIPRWVKYIDEETHCAYYFDVVSGDVTWKQPKEFAEHKSNLGYSGSPVAGSRGAKKVGSVSERLRETDAEISRILGRISLASNEVKKIKAFGYPAPNRMQG